MTTDDRRPRPTFGVALERALHDLRWFAMTTALGMVVLAVLAMAAIRGGGPSWTEDALFGLTTTTFMGLVLIGQTAAAYFSLHKRQRYGGSKPSRPLFWVFMRVEYERFGLVSLLIPLPVLCLVWFFIWKVCIEQPFTWSVVIGLAGGLFTSTTFVLMHALVTLEQWYGQT